MGEECRSARAAGGQLLLINNRDQVGLEFDVQ